MCFVTKLVNSKNKYLYYVDIFRDCGLGFPLFSIISAAPSDPYPPVRKLAAIRWGFFFHFWRKQMCSIIFASV